MAGQEVGQAGIRPKPKVARMPPQEPKLQRTWALAQRTRGFARGSPAFYRPSPFTTHTDCRRCIPVQLGWIDALSGCPSAWPPFDLLGWCSMAVQTAALHRWLLIRARGSELILDGGRAENPPLSDRPTSSWGAVAENTPFRKSELVPSRLRLSACLHCIAQPFINDL